MLENKDIFYLEAWVPTHFLNYAPVDLWWLHHIINAGFIFLFGTLLGTKILAAVSAALIGAFFYFVLKDQKIKKPLFWTTLFILGSRMFFLRLFLERAYLLSIFFSLLIYYLIKHKKYWFIFFSMIIYTLIYEMSFFVLVLVLSFIAADLLLKKKIDFRLVIASFGGLLSGILVHPNTLNFIYGIYFHGVKLFWINYVVGAELNAGVEIQINVAKNFLVYNLLPITLFSIAIAIFFVLDKKTRTSIALLFYSGFWFIVSCVFSRGVEYWIPIGMIFVLINFYDFQRSKEFEIAKKFIMKNIGKIYFKAMAITFIVFILLINTLTSVFVLFDTVKENRNFDPKIKQANEWLIQNTQKGERVFYTSWSNFPRMFFNNQHTKYLTAFDPAFFYEYDPATYYTWANIAYHARFWPEAWPEDDSLIEQNPKQIMNALNNHLKTKIIMVADNKEDGLYKLFSGELAEFYDLSYSDGEIALFVYNRRDD